MSEVPHICYQNLYNNIPKLSEFSWNINGVSIVIKSSETYNPIDEKLYHRILKLIHCKSCANYIIQFSNIYGQHGPILANYYDYIQLYDKELFSQLYENSNSNFKRIFVENHIDAIHTFIRPLICNRSVECKQDTQAYQEILSKYWAPIHDILITITINWDMAGKCHSTRQSFRSIESIFNTMGVSADWLIKMITIMNKILNKLCIPFEREHITNRIMISIYALTELYNNHLCVSKFIFTHININKIILEKPTTQVLIQKLLTLIKNVDSFKNLDYQ